MDADLSQILLFGSLVTLFAATALVLLVRGDLAPAGRPGGSLGGGGRWFLGAGLGIGVIAFTIKLVIILALSSFPGQTIEPLLPDAASRTPPPGGEDPFAGLPGDVDRYAWQALPEVAPAPADNPTTAEKVTLGRRLFHDPALSSTRTVACASCHDVARGAGTDGRATAVGITGIPGARNAPTVWNAAFQSRLFWDGRAASLEDQALGPPLNPDEMGMPSLAALEQRVRGEASYAPAFDAAFGRGTVITAGRIAAAIAAYERTLVSGDSPYDRFVRGDVQALTASQKRGMWLFQSVGCVMCHNGANFSGASLVGINNPYAPLLAGRSAIARRYGLDRDKGRAPAGSSDGIWRIPSLRNVAVTGPYFHNGAVSDLAEAVRIMATAQLNIVLAEDGQQARIPVWSPERRSFSVVSRRVLDRRDVDDIVAFLKALTGDALAARVAGR
ncbi:MAG: c-type cytochrome [Magnetospirillum sp.]|nr:c-type cytochrome [Magnetospirillum sp.]